MTRVVNVIESKDEFKVSITVPSNLIHKCKNNFLIIN